MKILPSLLSRIALCVCTLLFFCALAIPATAQDLKAVFQTQSTDQYGLQELQYKGVTLYKLNFGVTDDIGAPLYVPGQSSTGRTWNVSTKTLRESYNWGYVDCQYLLSGNNLNIKIEVRNNTGSPRDGLTVLPLGLRFPQQPIGTDNVGFDKNGLRVNFNTDAPAVQNADFGSGNVTIVNPDVSTQLGVGFVSGGGAEEPTLYRVFVSSNPATYKLSQDWPVFNNKIAPNSSAIYNVSLRFSPPGTDTYGIAGDVYSAYANANPYTLNWTDRRPIGQVFLSQPTGQTRSNTDLNARGWDLHDSVGINTDIQSAAGKQSFRTRMLDLADRSIVVLKKVGAQGAITWDVEGQQYPQPDGGTNPPNAISFVGSPELAYTLAPETQAVLVDYFNKFKAANLRVGVTIRPQQVTNGNGTAIKPGDPISGPTQQNVADIYGELQRKIAYARTTWGCTLFYIDSNRAGVNPDDLAAVKRLSEEFPDCLLIPEHSTFKYYAYSAPYNTLQGAGATTVFPGTPSNVRRTYPKAFSAIQVESSATTYNAIRSQAVAAVRAGDVLLFNCWYEGDGFNQTKSIYDEAYANRAPVAYDTNVDTYVGTSVVKGLLGSDADGDPLTFRIVNNAMYGTSEIKRDTDGNFKLFYTSLNRFYGNDRVTYLAEDNRGGQSNVATVNINFVNRPPVAQDNNMGVASGALVSQYLFGTDPDNDALTFRLVNNPLHGTGEIKLDPQGKWRVYYQSVPNYVGSDRITFIAIDAKKAESRPPATISINVVRTSSASSAMTAVNPGSGNSS